MCFLWQLGELALVSLKSAPGGLWLKITVFLWVMCVCVHLFWRQIAEEGYGKEAYNKPVNQLSIKLHMSLPGGLQIHVGWDQLCTEGSR